MLKKLQEYLNNTSQEQLERDWAELEKYNQFGPEVEEVLRWQLESLIERQINEAMKETNLLDEVNYLIEYKNDNRLGEKLQVFKINLRDKIVNLITKEWETSTTGKED